MFLYAQVTCHLAENCCCKGQQQSAIYGVYAQYLLQCESGPKVVSVLATPVSIGSCRIFNQSLMNDHIPGVYKESELADHCHL